MLALERKALLVLKQVNMAEIARQLGCGRSDVSRVVLGKNEFETPLSRRIKVAVAKAVSRPIAELWPELEEVESDTPSNSHATDEGAEQ